MVDSAELEWLLHLRIYEVLLAPEYIPSLPIEQVGSKIHKCVRVYELGLKTDLRRLSGGKKQRARH